MFKIKRILFITFFLAYLLPTHGQSDTIQELDIYSLSLEELLQVEVISAGKKVEQMSDIPASVEVIERKDIEAYGYSSLEEIISSVTGYYVMDDLSYTFSLAGVRGFMSQNGTGIIILINGISQVRKGFESYSIRESSVPVECIDRIEIIRGPMSVLYGTGAFFGVINIITDKSETKKIYGQAAISAGSLKTKKVSLALSGSEGDLNYSVNSGYNYSYGRNFSLSDMTNDLTKFETANASINTDGRLEGWDKYFDMSVELKSFYCKLTYLEMMQETYGVFASLNDGTLLENSKVNMMMGFDKSFTEKININASFRYNLFNNYMEIPWLFEDYYARENIRANSYEAELRLNYTPVEQFNLTVGVNQNTMLSYSQIWDYTLFSGLYNNHNRQLDNHDNAVSSAGFIQADYSPFDKLKIVAGFRLEKMSDYNYIQSFGSDTTGTNGNDIRTEFKGTYNEKGVEFIPRVALLYEINNSNNIKFFYGEALKRPSIEENIQNVKDIEKYGSLKNERIKTYELNYTTSISSVLNIKTSLFYNRLDNLITRIWVHGDNGDVISHQENAGTYTTQGAELSLLYTPTDNIRVNINGSYQKSEDKRDGFEDVDVAYSPDLLVHATILYKLGKYNFSVSGNYVDEMEPYWSGQAPGSANPGGRIGERTEAYYILSSNLRANNLFNTGIYANLKVTNLLDKKYAIPATNLKLWAEKGNPGYGRMFLLSLGYKF